METVRLAPVDAVVIDPLGDGGARIERVLALRESYRSLPIVVYTAMQAKSIRATVELARCGVDQVVLHRFDDEPRRFLELLERLPGYALADRILELLAPELLRFSGPLAHAVERLFRTPSRFRGVPDLAAAAGMTVRMVYRRFDDLVLASPAQLVHAARLLRAYAYLRDDQLLCVEVAAKLGYSSHRTLAEQMQDMIGLTPSDARAQLDPDQFIDRLLSRLVHRARAARPVETVPPLAAFDEIASPKPDPEPLA